MSLRFSQIPGRRERHLIRRQNNPLFPEATRAVTSDSLHEAQRLDHEEIESFIGEFHILVHDAVKLQPNEGSEVILALKERLDKAYEQACGLADDQTETKEAIKKLTVVVMNAVRTGAGNDAVALQELEQEELARSTHQALLECDLVADLLCPDSPITESELPATLLSTDEDELTALLELFDDEQLSLLSGESQKLLDGCDDVPERAKLRLQQIVQASEAR
ncbi:MAG: hypothetical protein RPU34_02735 [Candidatus Sedimenticola sp. (ex Thyasira tokunagai)]